MNINVDFVLVTMKIQWILDNLIVFLTPIPSNSWGSLSLSGKAKSTYVGMQLLTTL